MNLRSILLCCLAYCSTALAEGKVRDYFATAPDSIFPLLTKNNRLDCLDFMENNMKARVKNRMDEHSEMTVLTASHLSMQISKRSRMDLYLIQDSLLCLVQTYMGPVEDSHVRFYNRQWKPVQLPIHRPEVSEFVKGHLDAESLGLLRQLPLMKATVDTTTLSLIWELQTGELSKKQKKAAEGNLQPVAQSLKLK